MKIENFREEAQGSFAVAIFDVYWPEARLTFRNLRLGRSKKGHHFVSFPSFKVERGEKPEYVAYFQFSDEKQREFLNKVRTELEPFIRQMNREQPSLPIGR